MKDSRTTPVHGGEILEQKEDHGVQKKVVKIPVAATILCLLSTYHVDMG